MKSTLGFEAIKNPEKKSLHVTIYSRTSTILRLIQSFGKMEVCLILIYIASPKFGNMRSLDKTKSWFIQDRIIEVLL